MPTIEIFQGRGASSFDLSEILALIEPFTDGLEWYAFEFEPTFLLGKDGTNKQAPPEWVLTLWHRIEEAENGIKVDFQEMKKFATYVGQTINALFIAIGSGGTPPVEPIDLNSPQYDIVVQAFDATLWAVTSHDQTLIETIEKHFTDTKIVAQTSRYY